MAHATGHGPRLMQQRAGEYDRATRGRAVSAQPELRESSLATGKLFGVQVDGAREAAVCGGTGGVVAVGLEKPAVFTIIARDDVSFDVGNVELKRLFYQRYHAADGARAAPRWFR